MIIDGFTSKYPYTDFHTMNLDWLLAQMLQLRTDMKDFVNLNTIKYADPIQWNITTQYQGNTVVVEPVIGDAYLSTQPVPSGVAITDTDYWTLIGSFGSIFSDIKSSIAAADEGPSTVAGANRAVDDLVWLSDKLYVVTAPIATGESYVSGTNCELVTVELLLKKDREDITLIQGSILTMAGNISDEVADRIAADNVLRSSILSMAGEIEEVVVYTTPEKFGAVGDGVIDDTQAVAAAIATGKPVVMTKRYKCDTGTALRNFITGDGSIICDSVSIESGTVLEGVTLNLSELLGASITGNDEHIKIIGCTLTGQGVRIQYGDPGTENLLIAYSDITSDKYPIVTNDTELSNIRIIGNNLTGPGDCVELNSPNTDSKQIVVGLNTMYDGDESIEGAGFSVGMSHGTEIAVIGNVSTKSMLQGVHMEQDTSLTNVIGNVFSNCGQRGAHMLSGGKHATNLIVGNIFEGVKEDAELFDAGVTQIYGSESDGRSCIIANNVFSAFNTGIYQNGDYPVISDTNMVYNCNRAVVAATEVLGTVVLSNGKLCRAADIYGCPMVENIIIPEPVTTINAYFEHTTNHCMVVHGLHYHMIKDISTTEASLSLTPTFKHFYGKVTIRLTFGSYHDVLTVDESGAVLLEDKYGALVLTVTAGSAALSLTYKHTSNSGTCRIAVDIDGVITI